MNRGRVRIVLVRPETPANIGAVARSIGNTDLDGLDLVAPGDWRTLECWRTAWGAHDKRSADGKVSVAGARLTSKAGGR